MAGMLINEYSNRVAQGELRGDLAQHQLMERLNTLRRQLADQQPRKWLKKFRGKNNNLAPRGLYVWGPVGRGKTMLMDLFFASVDASQKQRAHFHGFMQEVHQRIHTARKNMEANDAIQHAAGALRKDVRLLCIDEMQIADIADAMIIGRLFDALIKRGTAIVTTSNVPPFDLYKNGLNRSLFLPFIKLIEERLDVISLDGAIDYRLGRVKGYESFITPLGPDADRRVQQMWERLTDTKQGEPRDIAVLGRVLLVPQAERGCARFSFAGLCEAAIGPPDYLAIAQAFQTVFVEGIPALGPEKRNEAKRFVLLIDTLYDNRVRLVVSSEMPAELIYPSGDHSFEFTRTVSRLQEMQAASWWGGRIVET